MPAIPYLIWTSLLLSIIDFCYYRKKINQSKKDKKLQRVPFGMLIVFLITSYILFCYRTEYHSLTICFQFTQGRIIFLCWVFILFYFLIGQTRHFPIVSYFCYPFIIIFFLLAAVIPVPQALEAIPEIDYLLEIHLVLIILSYGAFMLAAVNAIMFIIFNTLIKRRLLQHPLYFLMPAINSLLKVVTRLQIIGISYFIPAVILVLFYREQSPNNHWTHSEVIYHIILPSIICTGYIILLLWQKIKGLPGKLFAYLSIVLFSLTIILMLLF